MDLIKEKWDEQDFKLFKTFERGLKRSEHQCKWEQNITQTKLECLGPLSKEVKKVSAEIKRGNFLSFIQNIEIETLFESIVCAKLISSIKNFDVFEKELTSFVNKIDNWASCDSLSFAKHKKENLFILAKKYLANQKTFVRRVGVRIYFELIKDEKYLADCFKMLNNLKAEQEYYVNMCAAWLLCECFIKHRNQTLKFFEENQTNSFIINRAISKCRDSFRVSVEDKKNLLKYKRA